MGETTFLGAWRGPRNETPVRPGHAINNEEQGDRISGDSELEESEHREAEEERAEERTEIIQNEQGRANESIKGKEKEEEGLGQDGLRLDPQDKQKSRANVKMNPKVYAPTKAEIEIMRSTIAHSKRGVDIA